MKKILGLDLGTNSIGWALIYSDFDSKTGQIVGVGSRIIPMSQDVLGIFDSGQSYSQTKERTGFRGTRRLRERHLLRRERLHRILNLIGFLPPHYSGNLNRFGKFSEESEPKIAYQYNQNTKRYEFIFQQSFEEMLKDFTLLQPHLVENGKKIPLDWTIYYLRKKALTQKIEKEELAWLLLNFNQKRGYYQLRGEEEDENPNKLVGFHSLIVSDVIADEQQKGKDEIWYSILLENGWIYRRASKIPLFEWKGKTKEFIVTTDLNDDGSIKTDKEGKEKRSFRAPGENDWTLVKTKTEQTIEQTEKTVGQYIYDTLIQCPDQKINGRLIRVIERKFYRDELRQILNKQREFFPELNDKSLYFRCLEELYPNNEAHRKGIENKDLVHFFLDDIIFYQRPLKSKKSLIADCRYESRKYQDKAGNIQSEPIKCIAKSHPLFQEFRLWQFLRNLKIHERESFIKGELKEVTSEYLKTENDWVDLFDFLNNKKEISQDALLKRFKLKADTHRWNYIDDKDKKYPCNEIRSVILSKLSKVENIPANFIEQYEESLWHILYSVEDKNEIEKALKSFANKRGLGDDFAEAFKKLPPFKKEYGSYSAKTIKKLLPLMRIGKYWVESAIPNEVKDRIEAISDRLKSIEYNAGKIDEITDDDIPKQVLKSFVTCENPLKGLNTYQACYAVYNRHSEEGDVVKWKTADDIKRLKQHSLRNPIVEQVINETLQVVKEIWQTYGDGKENFFNEIHVELGREMKNPADKRKRMTARISENENTNLRIKALLAELKNDPDMEAVRPYSPMQQEILKIYEEAILDAANEIPDDILKISKSAQPSASELISYKLWLEQGYRSPYTGVVIPLNKLFTPAYEIEHIIPQSRYFDDSLSNKIICESAVNKDKDNATAYEYIKRNGTKMVELDKQQSIPLLSLEKYEQFVKDNYSKNPEKKKKLLMEDIPESFIARQMNDSRYISKVVKSLLSNIVREEGEQEAISKHIVVLPGSVTSKMKEDWGLNHIWNDIISPRFERLNEMTNTKKFGDINPNTGKFLPEVPLELSKGFTKKRIDHRHHSLDAVVIASLTKDHVNYLSSINANRTNYSLVSKLRNIEKRQITKKDEFGNLIQKKINVATNFHKPWETFTQDTKEKLLTTVVSFKQNLRVINKTVNKYERWETDENGHSRKVKVKQTKGDNWAIRKPMHKDTVSGLVSLRFKKPVTLSVAVDNWEMIVDKPLRKQIKELVVKYNYDKKMLLKYFKDRKNNWNEQDVSRVEIYYFDNDNAASRVKLDDSFSSKKIESITDFGIQKILKKHLKQYDTLDGKEHPELAFSPEGIDKLNENLKELNGGKPHQPIYKVRTYEPKGNKFNVGVTGNKKTKFVEAAKGTNLFFAIYQDKNEKRIYQTVPFNIVVENQKQGLSSVSKRYVDEKGNEYKHLFTLSPNDLVYVPTEEERENSHLVDFNNLTKEQMKRIYKMVSSSGSQCFFIRNDIAISIVNKFEFSALNKTEKSIDNTMIKEVCYKLRISKLGEIVSVNK